MLFLEYSAANVILKKMFLKVNEVVTHTYLLFLALKMSQSDDIIGYAKDVYDEAIINPRPFCLFPFLNSGREIILCRSRAYFFF